MADAAEIEIGAVADVALVLVRPLDDTEVVVCRFHGSNLVFCFRLGNRFCDLAFLVGFRVPVIGSAESDGAFECGMLELAVRAFLAVDGKPCRAKILEEVADLAGHG